MAVAHGDCYYDPNDIFAEETVRPCYSSPGWRREARLYAMGADPASRASYSSECRCLRVLTNPLFRFSLDMHSSFRQSSKRGPWASDESLTQPATATT